MLQTLPTPELDTPQNSALASDDLQAVLDAWHVATDRLQQTHEVLQREVRRLSDELEIKNRELARKNRLADLGQMASHVAHEVRNSLVPLTLYLSLLRRHLGRGGATADILDKMDAGFTALEATVNDLLQFTASREPCWQSILLAPLLCEICDSLSPQFTAQGIDADLDVPPQLRVTADRDMLRRAALNLMLNALDAMPQGGKLLVTGTASPCGVELEIADSGPGIHNEVVSHLFEPFFTTKSSGTGLGLAIVERIATALGGGVHASNCPQGGAAFTISLPLEQVEASA
jgi:signal transduction histidine kinase